MRLSKSQATYAVDETGVKDTMHASCDDVHVFARRARVD